MANIIISPSKYVQGKGELANIAQYATKLGKKPFILSVKVERNVLVESLKIVSKIQDANLFLKHSMESVLRTRLTVW